MTRQILGLKHEAYSYICNKIPRAIKSETIYTSTGTADIKLSDSVIMKVYEDGIILDLGMNKAEIESDDFRLITIRWSYERKNQQSRNCKCMPDKAYDWPDLWQMYLQW